MACCRRQLTRSLPVAATTHRPRATSRQRLAQTTWWYRAVTLSRPARLIPRILSREPAHRGAGCASLQSLQYHVASHMPCGWQMSFISVPGAVNAASNNNITHAFLRAYSGQDRCLALVRTSVVDVADGKCCNRKPQADMLFCSCAGRGDERSVSCI